MRIKPDILIIAFLYALALGLVSLLIPMFLGLNTAHAQGTPGAASSQWLITGGGNKYIKPVNNLYGLMVPGLATSTTGCLSVSANGWISPTGVACGSGGGSGTFPFGLDTNYGQVVYSTSTPTLWFKSGLFASSTSQIQYASTTALSVSGAAYFPGSGIWNNSGNVGIGTTSPYRLLSLTQNSSAGVSPNGVVVDDSSNGTWTLTPFWTMDFTDSDVTTPTAGRVRARLGVSKTTTTGPLNAFNFQLATTSCNADCSNYLDALTISQSSGMARVTIGSTTMATPRNFSVVGSDSSVSLAAQGDASVGIYNMNQTDSTFSELSFGSLDTASAKVEGAKVAAVATSHTAGATSFDLSFVNRNLGTMSEKMRVLSDGKVGIGVTAPSGRLHITGNQSISAFSTSGSSFNSAAGTYTDLTTAAAATIADVGINTFRTPTLVGTNAFTISNAANMYISAAPTCSTNVTCTAAYALWVDSGNARFDGLSSFGSLSDGVAPTNTVTVRGPSDVVATSSSQVRLQSQRTAIIADELIGAIDFESQDTSYTVAVTDPGRVTSSIRAISEVAQTTSAGGTAITFSTLTGSTETPANLAERLRITGAGLVGLGTTTPSQVLSVQGNALFSGNLNVASLTATGTVTFTGISSGLVKSTSGILSVATADTDYQVPLTFGDGLTRTSNDIDCDTASGSVFGCLTSTDWNTFNNKQAALSFTYPLVNTANSISLAFGTTTANSWSALQQFNGNASTTQFSVYNNAYFGATATTTITSLGRIGVGSSTPAALIGINAIAGVPAFMVGSSTTLMQIDANGKLVVRDIGTGYDGVVSGLRQLGFQIGTTTAWAGSTTGPYIVKAVVPFNATIRQAICDTDAGTVGVDLYHTSTHLAYLNASTTKGIVKFTSNNTVTAGETLYMVAGTPASSPTSLSCTIGITETP